RLQLPGGIDVQCASNSPGPGVPRQRVQLGHLQSLIATADLLKRTIEERDPRIEAEPVRGGDPCRWVRRCVRIDREFIAEVSDVRLTAERRPNSRVHPMT